jgi:hexokinase
MSFVRNAVATTSLVEPGEIFQVLVIGGTNGETATLRFNADNTISIIDYQLFPGLAKFESADALLQFVDNHVDDIANNIGLNFAFGLDPLVGDKGQMDGIMLGGDNKGHALNGLTQKPVGAIVKEYFTKIHHREVTVSVANDIVCLIASVASKEVDSNTLVAGIVGTGYNMAFFLDPHTIINVQAGGFKGFKPTASGQAIDRTSPNPGHQQYEKELAGGELFKHYNILADQHQLGLSPVASSKELANLATVDQGAAGNLSRALFARSAGFLAAQFAGLYNFKDRPQKLTAIMQGSLFWEGPNYKEAFVQKLEELGVPTEAIMFETMERSGIIGAAKLITGAI